MVRFLSWSIRQRVVLLEAKSLVPIMMAQLIVPRLVLFVVAIILTATLAPVAQPDVAGNMRRLEAAINGLQLAHADKTTTFAQLGSVRRELIAAIRNCMLDAMIVANPKLTGGQAYLLHLAKFDKALSPE